MHAITHLIYTQESTNVRPSAMRHHALRKKYLSAAAKGGDRFQCKDCRKTITVRDGRIVTGSGPRVRDWRTEVA